MYVLKRDGRREPVQFDKITARIKKLCYGFDPKMVDPTVITMKVIQGVVRAWHARPAAPARPALRAWRAAARQPR